MEDKSLNKYLGEDLNPKKTDEFNKAIPDIKVTLREFSGVPLDPVCLQKFSEEAQKVSRSIKGFKK